MFDAIVAILQKNYEKWQYTHVLTPSVEPVDILKRGGDIIDKQVYGLYGLAQGPEDTKEYALHFDLTVPFARYTLDHMHELTFPFKRYQMQPVRRGERTKRGRYKEFWQFDVDAIWRSESEVGVRYDAESIIVSYQALAEIFSTFGIQKKLAVHISNIAVTKSYLTSLGVIGDLQKNVCKLLDDYYKMTHETFVEKISAHADATAVQAIAGLVQSRDHNDPQLRACDARGDLDQVLSYLKEFDIPVTYDLAIMRGHGYYTGTVVEIFLPEDMALGAIAGGGAYRNMTDFIDPKHSFS